MKRPFSILILVTILSCNSDKRDKPSDVPKDAIWKGGVDGGCWISFKSITSDKLDVVIFYEDGGEWERGLYKKIGNCDVPANEIINSVVGFNGQELVFKNNSCNYQKAK